MIYDVRKAPEVFPSIIALGRLSCGEDPARPTINTNDAGEDPARPTINTNDAGKTLRDRPSTQRTRGRPCESHLRLAEPRMQVPDGVFIKQKYDTVGDKQIFWECITARGSEDVSPGLR